MKIRNVILALKDQLPLKRLFRNFFISGNAWGLFSKYSHQTKEGKLKVEYGSKETAMKASESMTKKHSGNFRPYKCMRCDGFHIGKNKN